MDASGDLDGKYYVSGIPSPPGTRRFRYPHPLAAVVAVVPMLPASRRYWYPRPPAVIVVVVVVPSPLDGVLAMKSGGRPGPWRCVGVTVAPLVLAWT